MSGEQSQNFESSFDGIPDFRDPEYHHRVFQSPENAWKILVNTDSLV